MSKVNHCRFKVVYDTSSKAAIGKDGGCIVPDGVDTSDLRMLVGKGGSFCGCELNRKLLNLMLCMPLKDLVLVSRSRVLPSRYSRMAKAVLAWVGLRG